MNLLKFVKKKEYIIYLLKTGQMYYTFDYSMSIAVFHHLSDSDFKIAISEMIRTLKPGGHGIITVWSVENQQ